MLETAVSYLAHPYKTLQNDALDFCSYIDQSADQVPVMLPHLHHMKPSFL